jgi:hypothetical protein
MSAQVSIWAPILKDNEQPTMSLGVLSKFQPNKSQYRSLLQQALESLISKNPKQAQQDLEEVSVPSSPDLCNIRAEYPTNEWAVQISQSDQMEMLLARIDWQKDNPPRELAEENLPSFMDILQML